ncbi:MAG: acyltransferase [Candidatus Thermoplasmatota archaeon]|nr:acyltransferase [Candidatus Thermoplasmatota archaeon]
MESFIDESTGENAKRRLKSCGDDVKIFPLAKIVKAEQVEIGDHSMIDDFTFINGGRGIKIGRYAHIASFVSIIGGGELVLGDYCVIACGARILTGTDSYRGGRRMSTALPKEQRNVIVGKVIVGKDAFIGTNVVVHPNVTIGEGAIIGSNSLVLKDVKPWTINVGSPCKKIGERPRPVVKDI